MNTIKPFEVVSVIGRDAGEDAIAKISHGDCRNYTQASSLARIAQRTFKDRIVLVLIPSK